MIMVMLSVTEQEVGLLKDELEEQQRERKVTLKVLEEQYQMREQRVLQELRARSAVCSNCVPGQKYVLQELRAR